ncbi:hypothetical protein F4556_003343 [Kitasatospora gansuensis]|uniref:FRG domain-containing protein n=3 Tax=Kitasatospora TaxID=2063 RepID=A0A7W7SC78_9ACTN|nr:FRG domain-containing protein [Kitasatospora gansuensis]MBB4947808.1 hypothetical protein [Kitasatospora gansuensis]
MDAPQRYSPGRFFRDREINEKVGINSEKTLWEWIEAGAQPPRPKGSVPLPPESEQTLYRGQPDAGYALTSRLFREIWANDRAATESKMQNAERHLLKVLKYGEGLGRLMTDGELLAVLQHHGIPTRLIDVSAGPFEALFFAVDHAEDTDGRLFIIELPAAKDGLPDTIDLTAQEPLEWEGTALGPHYAKSTWTNRVAVIHPHDLDPRMRAQRGRFLVGGLTASYPDRTMMFKGKRLAAQQLDETSNLSIFFPKNAVSGTKWPAKAWTVRIKKQWKRGLRDRLKALDKPITMDSMYPPIGEVRRLALREIGRLSRTYSIPAK